MATRKIFELKKRIRAVCGGTSASKTISILFWCIDRAQSYPSKHNGQTELISIVSETYPHLEKGAMLDFENIMKDAGYWEDSRWHGTKHQYTFESGSKIEFFSVDTYGKAHGPRRDILFVNEVNNMEYKIVDQLIIRTKKIIWMDWNPTVEFWFYTEMLGTRDDIDFLTLTYKDNEALDSITVAEIESHKGNLNWWKVYGLGQLGEVAGKIYRGWKLIDEIPHEARLERRGLDFGFSNDPACLVDVYYYNGGYIFDEQFYQLELHNKPIADFIKNLEPPNCLVIADSAEPKSIDELRINGINVIGAEKGPGSKNKGISYIQDQKISITKRSVNGIKEYRRYLWKTDKDGVQLREAEKGNDHFLDAARYAMESLRPPDDDEEIVLSGNIMKMWR